MKIHHWLLALLAFYVVIAALPDARMIWSLDERDSPEAEPLSTLALESGQPSPPLSYELLLLLDLAALAVADEVSTANEITEPIQQSGGG